MKVIWSPLASEELIEAIAFIAEDKPDASVRVPDRIYTQVMRLAEMPNIGRLGQVYGTRELIFHPWPYIVVYQVLEDAVRIVRIRHAAREWPEH